MVNTILITTSGTGTRLGKLTKYTNKSLVNVGDKYALCYIIENYNVDDAFIITIGHYGSYVKQFVELAYPTHNITFVEIDKYEGVGSSLGYSLLKCKELLQKPFYFHCCDSIILERSQLTSHNGDNILFVFNTLYNDIYSTVKINSTNNCITKLNKKGSKDYEYGYSGVFYLKTYNLFWQYLEEIYNTNTLNFELSDVDSIIKMINHNIEFKYILLSDYYDIGNSRSLDIIQNIVETKYEVLSKPNESICFLNDKVIKFNNNVAKTKQLYLRTLHMNNITPIIFNYSDNFICMEKINGTILSKINYNCITELLNFCLNKLWNTPIKDETFKLNCHNFYIIKTRDRIKSLNIENEKHIINNLNCLSIENLINSIDTKYYITDTFVKFHGDFIYDNILKRNDDFILIDWRESFDNNLEYGDIYYEFAKLKHNLIFNHKNILNKLFVVDINENNVYIDLKCNYVLIEQLTDLDNFLIKHNYDVKKVNILMSIVWINMSPLYDGDLRWFLFYFGKYNLQKILNNAC